MYKFINDDCLKALKKIDSESVNLIYADPPFNTKTDKVKNSKNRTKKNSYKDYWKSESEYIKWFEPILIECHRVLKSTGAIYIHCDWRMNHHIRLSLDKVFQKENFRNEIIWSYKRWSAQSSSLQKNHQNIYFYAKTKKHIINQVFVPYSPTTNVDQILQERGRDEFNISVYKKKDGKIIFSNKEKKGVLQRDVFEIPYLNPKAKERVDYPTQKPIELIKRIFNISSKKNDLILDPFCGSGTTITTAKILNRNCITIDINKRSIDIAKKRFENPIESKSEVLEGYDKFEETKNDNYSELKLLKEIKHIPVKRNTGIDALVNYKNNVVAIRILGKNENDIRIKEIFIKTCNKKLCKGIFINNYKSQNDLFKISEIKNFIFLNDVNNSNLQQKFKQSFNLLFK